MEKTTMQTAIEMAYGDILEIETIVEKYPISWHDITKAIREAKDLIVEIGPEALLTAVNNEKMRRGINNDE